MCVEDKADDPWRVPGEEYLLSLLMMTCVPRLRSAFYSIVEAVKLSTNCIRFMPTQKKEEALHYPLLPPMCLQQRVVWTQDV